MAVSNKKVNRILAFAAVVVLTFIVIFSEYFIHNEANHECHEEQCPICIVINQTNNILSSILRNSFLKTALLIFLCLIVDIKLCSQKVVNFSLVNNNVRLNE
ncbi:MAG: hypothetical protein J6M39_09925 [Lachnospiraceae bacterium]|nr:hypothetical protein [Lachnospiraceae bacterium]